MRCVHPGERVYTWVKIFSVTLRNVTSSNNFLLD